MKKSKYNFFYQYDKNSEKMFAYNSRTNALAIIARKDFLKYEDYINNKQAIDDEKLIKDLRRGGFLLDNKVDEIKLLKHNLLDSRYSTRGLGITIAPTLECNFACVYCYEKGKNHGTMTTEVQEKIIKLIEHQSNYIDNIAITWYGGEPLLAIDIIESITDKVLHICQEKGIRYSGTIVTNGYNISREVLLKLKELKIKYMQVTIDGPEDIHNSMRPLKTGGPTFRKILENLSSNKDLLPSTNLRVNIDKENQGCLKSILSIIKDYGLKGTVNIYPGYIEPTNDCYSINRCLLYSEYSKIDYEFTNNLVEEGFIPDINHRYPTIKSNVCTADTNNSLVIDPEGNVYKCWSDIGRSEYKISNLNDNEATNIDKFMEYLLYDPTVDSECIDCKVLPLCMGGCPRRRIDKTVDRCSIYKYVLEDYILNIADNKALNLKNKVDKSVKGSKV